MKNSATHRHRQAINTYSQHDSRASAWLTCAACLYLVTLMTGCQSHDPRDVNDPTLRVMSYNLRVSNIGDTITGRSWNSRRGDAMKLIKEYDPDLMGTQEGKHGQVKYVRKKLKWFDMHGAGRSNGKTSGEFCAIYYRTLRFTEIDSGHIWFNESGKPGKRTWGSVFPRMASWVLLDDTFTGHQVLAVNTHLDVISSESREKSAMMIRDLIAQYPDAYVVVTGDFNCGIGSKPFRILTGRNQRRLIDTYTAAGHKDGKKDGTHNSFRGKRSGKRIDWVLVSPKIKVLAAGIIRDKPLLDGYPSDHFPVTADLRLPKE